MTVCIDEKIDEFIEGMKKRPFYGNDTFTLGFELITVGNDVLAAIGSSINQEKERRKKMEQIGQNVSYEVDDKILTLEIDLSRDFGPSRTGKTIIIATTSGNKRVDDTGAIIGLNVYRKP